jgi:dienelactone hydrolase
MRKFILAAIVFLPAACVSPAHRADDIAQRAGLARGVAQSDTFHHILYYTPVSRGEPLFVFVEGDGTPFVGGGRKIAADPTPTQPVALQLAAATSAGSVLYVGRPCYFGYAAAPECHPSDWTVGRFSQRVLASMVEIANRYASDHGYQDIILVGHSGGGALVVLMAPEIHGVRAVVTVAGNLDPTAWTTLHGYTPLFDSLDPVEHGPPAHPWPEIHVVGGKDENVPPSLMDRYLARHPGAEVWLYAGLDHSCCWQAEWPALETRILQRAKPDTGGRMRTAPDAATGGR